MMPTQNDKQNNRVEKEVKSILTETDNPAVIHDVVDAEDNTSMPEQYQAFEAKEELDAFEENIVAHSVDGKTWNSVHDQK